MLPSVPEGARTRELVDVVDVEDRVVRTVTRHEMRQAQLRHRAVYVLVFDDAGRLLVHRRTETKDVYPGHWDVAVGGVVAAGELYDSAARRELAEEVGLDDVPLRRICAFRWDEPPSPVNGWIYTCTHAGPFRLQPEEVAQVEWMDLEAVFELAAREPTCPDSLQALCVYLDRLAGVRAS